MPTVKTKKFSYTAAIDVTGVYLSDFYGNNSQEPFHFQHQMGKRVAMIISIVCSA